MPWAMTGQDASRSGHRGASATPYAAMIGQTDKERGKRMDKHGWQIVAFFAIAWAVAASAIAWVNKGQIEHREPITVDAEELAQLSQQVYTLQMENAALRRAEIVPAASDITNAGRGISSRCIDGILFTKIDGALTDVGRC